MTTVHRNFKLPAATDIELGLHASTIDQSYTNAILDLVGVLTEVGSLSFRVCKLSNGDHGITLQTASAILLFRYMPPAPLVRVATYTPDQFKVAFYLLNGIFHQHDPAIPLPASAVFING